MYHVISRHRYKYFLTIVDNFKCFTLIFLMKTKFNDKTIIYLFIHMIHTQFGMKVKQLRSNSARELQFWKCFVEQGF